MTHHDELTLKEFMLIREATPLRKVYKLMLLFCLLNFVDYYSTMQAIAYGAAEGNSIAGYIVDHNALHYFKLVGVGLLSFYLIHLAKKNTKSQASVIRVLRLTNLGFSVLLFITWLRILSRRMIIC